MSDETTVQESANQALDNESSPPRQLIRVEKAEFTKLLHQVLASKNLFIYLQSVSGENKKLRQQNEELRKLAHRSQKTVGQIVIGDSKLSVPAQAPESGSSSLPSYFDFDTRGKEQHLEGRYTSLGDHSVQHSLGYFSKSPKSLLQSSIYVSEPSLARSDTEMRERGLKEQDVEEKEKCDPCKDEETGLSLKVDGDVRSMGVIPQFLHPQVGKVTSPVTSPVLSPTPSLTSGYDIHESVSSDNQSEDSNPGMRGVSKQYFDVVVKELAKSKQLIKQLLAKSRESPKEVMDAIYLKQMLKSLEEENRRLKDSNHYFRNLLVTEATSGDQRLAANNEILSYHDMVQKLERQVELKDQALDQLNKQNEMWKRYGQKAMAAQHSTRRDDLVFSPQMQDSESQTNPQSLKSISTQTEEVHWGHQSERDESALLAKSQDQILDLERMIGDLTTENQASRETVELLTAQNRNLESSYKQLMQNLKDLERNQDTVALQHDLQSLSSENEEMKKRLKENAEEMKFLRYQIQSAQNDQGALSAKKTRAEAMLKSERERSREKETQLFTQCSKLQQRIDRLESENEKLHMKISSHPANVAIVQPVMQDMLKEPTSMPVTSQDFLSQLGGKETSLMGNIETKGHAMHLSDPCLLKLGQKQSEEDEQFQCHHCLRNDFHDEKSFLVHMQKCGD